MLKVFSMKFFVIVLLASFCEAFSIEHPEGEIKTTEIPKIFETTTQEEFLDAVKDESDTEDVELSPALSDIINSQEASKERGVSEEIPNGELHDGSFFVLMLTILKNWQDEYSNKQSVVFKTLATDLGSQLIDFIDNSQEAKEPNITDFKLIEVRPCSDSLEKIYVTFIVTSKRELKGEELRDALTNQINIYGAFYDFKALFDGFVLKNISKEEAESSIGYDNMNLETSVSFTPMPHLAFSPEDLPQTNEEIPCESEKIQRGSTSIYIFEGQQACVDGVRNMIGKKSDDDSRMYGDQPKPGMEAPEMSQCGKGIKRSMQEEEEETVVVIRKRGNKVFVEF